MGDVVSVDMGIMVVVVSSVSEQAYSFLVQ